MQTFETLSPNILRQLELLRLRSRRNFLGTRQGGHLSMKRGHGIEFSDYRKYELGDDPRHIDWGVFARSERIYIKRFQEEQDLSVFMLVDTSASMYYPESDLKWFRAQDLALSLSYIALMQQDRVRLSLPGLYQSPYVSGGSAFHRLARSLKDLPVRPEANFLNSARQAIASMTFPGIAFVISDFLMPLNELRMLIDQLRAKNLDITAIQVLGQYDLQPFADESGIQAIDSETQEEIYLTGNPRLAEEYRLILEDHNFKVAQMLMERSVNFCQTKSTQSLELTLKEDLTGAGLLQ